MDLAVQKVQFSTVVFGQNHEACNCAACVYFDMTHLTHIFGMDDVFEVLKSNFSILPDCLPEDVFEPPQVLSSHLSPRTVREKNTCQLFTLTTPSSRNKY